MFVYVHVSNCSYKCKFYHIIFCMNSLFPFSQSHTLSQTYTYVKRTHMIWYMIMQYNIYYVANGDIQIKHSYDLSIAMLYNHDIPYNYTDGCEILIKLSIR